MAKRKTKPSEPRVIRAAVEAEVIALPAAERGLNPVVVARYDRLKRRLARNDIKPSQRAQAMDELDALLRGLGDAAERAAISSAIAETVALAEGRGEDVAQKPNGSVRIMSRGGLRQAYEDGHLEPERGTLTALDLSQKGCEVRDDYEMTVGMTTPIRGEGATGFRRAAPQQKRVEAAYRLAQYRQALTARQWDVIELVCCQDVRLRSAAERLNRGFLGCRNSLRGGLAILAAKKPPELPKELAPKVVAAKTAAIHALLNNAA